MKSFFARLFAWLGGRTQNAPLASVPAPNPIPKQRRIPWRTLLALSRGAPGNPATLKLRTAEPLPGVVPKERLKEVLACDATPYTQLNAAGMGQYAFPGFPYLAELAQVPEYRRPGEVIAEEMTREGIDFRSTGDSDNSDAIAKLDAWFLKHKVMAHMRQALERDAWFGRCQLYIDMQTAGSKVAASERPEELLTPLSLSDKKIAKGSFLGLRLIEPTWSYPGIYNSTNPLAANYYKPDNWFVMGNTVNNSRLLMFCSNPVPQMLKAAYSFGGVSLSQLAQPYVNNWLRTRQAVSNMLHSYSTSGIKTNLSGLLASPSDDGTGSGQQDVIDRAQLFSNMRDNMNTMLLDMGTEEFFQFNASIAGLDRLQAQSQEHMSAVTLIPLVKLFGITPSGLNSNSDGEIRVFYDRIAARQEKDLRDPLEHLCKIAQLDLFGKIDDSITFVFKPLYQLSATEEAAVRASDATSASTYIQAGVISALEERERLSRDPDSFYSGLDITTGPEQDDDDDNKNANTGAEPAQEEEGDPTLRADTRKVAGDSAQRRNRSVVSQKNKR